MDFEGTASNIILTFSLLINQLISWNELLHKKKNADYRFIPFYLFYRVCAKTGGYIAAIIRKIAD